MPDDKDMEPSDESIEPRDKNIEPTDESIEATTENGIPPENDPNGDVIATLCDPYRKTDFESGKYQVFQFIF